MGSVTVEDIIFDYIKERGIEDRIAAENQEKGKEKKARDTALEMLKRGFDIKEVADIIKMPLEWVQALANSLPFHHAQ